jgi:HEAT repeat protein
MFSLYRPYALLTSVLCLVASLSQPLFAADGRWDAATKESDLIALLGSGASPDQKAIACKKLAVCGTETAVPALAPLLTDKDLSSWARIALEAIPGPAADAALRQALDQTKGRLLIGVINSIGRKGDARAIAPLALKLVDPDPAIAGAAAIALGMIGGDRAAEALCGALPKAPEKAGAVIAEGCIRCADGFLTRKQPEKALRIYECVLASSTTKQRQLEATRGKILATYPSSLPLLTGLLRSQDRDFFRLGLQTARELPADQVTRLLVDEMWQSVPDRQSLFLMALADRKGGFALNAIAAAGRSGLKAVRATAFQVLGNVGNASCLPVLIDAASETDPDIAQTAMAALAKLPDDAADVEILRLLKQPSGKTSRALLEAAGKRGIADALPIMLRNFDNPDPATRAVAVQAVGLMGQDKEAAELVRILRKTKSPEERGDIESALLQIASRKGSGCTAQMLPLAKDEESGLRIIALHVLASAGGPEALGALKAATEDKDGAVQDEAVRTLSSWPNTWPEDGGVEPVLLAIIKTGSKMSHKVLAIRGYMQFVQGDKKLNNREKAAKVSEVIPLVERPEEKRLAISTLRTVPTAESLDLLIQLAGDESVADDAYSALVDLATKRNAGIDKAARQKALQTVTEKGASADLKKRAEEALKKLE